MKKFAEEFKQFIMRGNVMDLAVGVIIGGAFTGIVTSLNEDILTPLLGVFGGVDFSELTVKLGNLDISPTLHYGSFLTAVINFLINAFVIFCLVKAVNKVMTIGKTEEPKEEEPKTKECPYCKSQINIEATRCPHCTSELE